MRQFIVASHGRFAEGINESLSMLSGVRANVRTLAMYVDGCEDVSLATRQLIDETPETDDLVICTDLFGGSVNNEFTALLHRRPATFLITNMNLPLLIQLLFADENRPTEEIVREICAADETRAKYMNDLMDIGSIEAKLDEKF